MSFFPVRSFNNLETCLRLINNDDHSVKPNILILNKKIKLNKKKLCFKINNEKEKILIIDLFTSKDDLNFNDKFFLSFTEDMQKKSTEDDLINFIKLNALAKVKESKGA